MIQTHILSTALHLKWFISVEILGRKSGILQSEQYALMTILWPAELRLSLSKAEFLFPNRFHLVAVFRLQHELFLSFIDGKFINVSDNCKLYFRKHPLGSEKYLVFHGLHFHWFALFLILTPLEKKWYRKRHLQLKPQLKNMQIRKTEKDVCKGTLVLRVKNLTHLFGTPVGNDDIFHWVQSRISFLRFPFITNV